MLVKPDRKTRVEPHPIWIVATSAAYGLIPTYDHLAASYVPTDPCEQREAPAVGAEYVALAIYLVSTALLARRHGRVWVASTALHAGLAAVLGITFAEAHGAFGVAPLPAGRICFTIAPLWADPWWVAPARIAAMGLVAALCAPAVGWVARRAWRRSGGSPRTLREHGESLT